MTLDLITKVSNAFALRVAALIGVSDEGLKNIEEGFLARDETLEEAIRKTSTPEVFKVFTFIKYAGIAVFILAVIYYARKFRIRF